MWRQIWDAQPSSQFTTPLVYFGVAPLPGELWNGLPYGQAVETTKLARYPVAICALIFLFRALMLHDAPLLDTSSSAILARSPAEYAERMIAATARNFDSYWNTCRGSGFYLAFPLTGYEIWGTRTKKLADWFMYTFNLFFTGCPPVEVKLNTNQVEYACMMLKVVHLWILSKLLLCYKKYARWVRWLVYLIMHLWQIDVSVMWRERYHMTVLYLKRLIETQ